VRSDKVLYTSSFVYFIRAVCDIVNNFEQVTKQCLLVADKELRAVKQLLTVAPTPIIWPPTNCCPSQRRTQCSPAAHSAQPLLISGTVYQLPFEQHPLPRLGDDISRLICSQTTPPLTNLCFDIWRWRATNANYILHFLLFCSWGAQCTL